MNDQTRRKSAVTSFDVAREAGVSRASVSRAFQPGSNISPELRQHVLGVADRIGYRVNKMARSLNLQRSDLVGVIVSRLDNPYRSAQVQELASQMSRHGFHLVLFSIEPGEPVGGVLNLLLDYQVSGVIITSGAPDHHLAEECAKKEVPLILIDRGETLASADHVRGDDDTGGRLVADAFHARGREVLYLFEPMRHIYSFQRRLEALEHRALSLGLKVHRERMEGYDFASGASAAKSLLCRDIVRADGRSAMFFPNDIAALGALDACRAAGFQPPDAIGVMGYDDIPSAQWGLTQLSTVRQSPTELAERVVSILKDRIADPKGARGTYVLPVSASLRATH